MDVDMGSGLVIDGHSGTGKTSVLRVLAGLWPVSDGGSVARPPRCSPKLGTRNCFLFVPQSPYTTDGTLLEQVVYPEQADDEFGSQDTTRSKRVVEAIERVGLDYLVDRWGLHSGSKWSSHLSGGEMQRVGLARILYHRPTFAFLDEATSALDTAFEMSCLRAIQDAGVTCITISHREGTRLFHARVLNLAGGGKKGAWSI